MVRAVVPFSLAVIVLGGCRTGGEPAPEVALQLNGVREITFPSDYVGGDLTSAVVVGTELLFTDASTRSIGKLDLTSGDPDSIIQVSSHGDGPGEYRVPGHLAELLGGTFEELGENLERATIFLGLELISVDERDLLVVAIRQADATRLEFLDLEGRLVYEAPRDDWMIGSGPAGLWSLVQPTAAFTDEAPVLGLTAVR